MSDDREHDPISELADKVMVLERIRTGVTLENLKRAFDATTDEYVRWRRGRKKSSDALPLRCLRAK